jgi:hypothetical protein
MQGIQAGPDNQIEQDKGEQLVKTADKAIRREASQP